MTLTLALIWATAAVLGYAVTVAAPVPARPAAGQTPQSSPGDHYVTARLLHRHHIRQSHNPRAEGLFPGEPKRPRLIAKISPAGRCQAKPPPLARNSS